MQLVMIFCVHFYFRDNIKLLRFVIIVFNFYLLFHVLTWDMIPCTVEQFTHHSINKDSKFNFLALCFLWIPQLYSLPSPRVLFCGSEPSIYNSIVDSGPRTY